MRFMILVKASRSSEAGGKPTEKLLSEQVTYHEELAVADILQDAAGLKSSAHGWRIRYVGDERTVVEGPFADSNDLIAGYTIIRVASRDEAMEWSKRYPKPSLEDGDAEIDVREFFELEDFVQGPAVARFREIGALDRIARPQRLRARDRWHGEPPVR